MTCPTIPRLIHQMWSSPNVPASLGNPESWQQQNPDWTYCFWDDQALRAFMADHFPDLLPLFDTYPKKVQQADLGRYCLLRHFGGIYADIDTRCLTASYSARNLASISTMPDAGVCKGLSSMGPWPVLPDIHSGTKSLICAG
jgi:mannosyltransferase OCH1-like enzyme